MDEPGRAYSDSVKDDTSLRGPAFGISAKYRLPSLPILARIWTGVLRAHVETRHSGSYRGRLENDLEFVRDVRFEERAQDIWIPFLGPELGVAHALGSRFEIGAGVAALLFLPGSTPRTGTDGPLAVVTGRRRKPFDPQLLEPASGGAPVNLGNIELPREEALGTFWALFPNVRFRANF
jgi:hypothetical protein